MPYAPSVSKERTRRPWTAVGAAMLCLAVPALCQPKDALPRQPQPPPTPRTEDRILFSTNRDGNFELYIMTPDGQLLQRLTNTPQVQETDPCWSPNAQKIAFECDEIEIWTMWADGSGRMKLTRGRDPSWSPDGNRVVFSDTRHGNPELYTISIDDVLVRLTVTMAAETNPAWSPDGRFIAFQRKDTAGQDCIFIMQADGSDCTFITEGCHPAWSPDGLLIAFSHREERGYEICAMTVPRGVSRPLLSNDWLDRNPAWSPDGTMIAFDSKPDTPRERKAAGDDEEIVVMGSAGAQAHAVTVNYRVADIEPAWRPRLRDEPEPAGGRVRPNGGIIVPGRP